MHVSVHPTPASLHRCRKFRRVTACVRQGSTPGPADFVLGGTCQWRLTDVTKQIKQPSTENRALAANDT